MTEQAAAALRALGLAPECVDVERETERFLSEMQEGLAGRESSLMMLPTFLAASGTIQPDTAVAVLDAGGTNLRAARLRFDSERRPLLERVERSRMPGTERGITADEMFESFAAALLPMLSENGLATVCFSYAFRSLPGGEAEILELSKEVAVEGAVGRRVAAGIQQALRALGWSGPLQIKVINDTAAVLYSAFAAGAQNAVGFILGTGTNAAYLERTEAIAAAGEFPHPRMLVNLEAGGYALGPLGEVDRELDRESRLPGFHLHEKMVAGAYLGELTLRGAKKLAGLGHFTEAGKQALTALDALTMPQLSALQAGSGELAARFADAEDRALLCEISLAVQRRAGRLCAANIAAVLLQLRQGGETGEVTIAENGTTFQKAAALRESCMEQLSRLPALGRYRFTAMEDDTLIGSAAAALVG